MNKELIKLTKEAMGYTPTPDICANCAYMKRDFDPDTGTGYYCSYSNLCSFNVPETGYCTKFKKKEK